MTFPRRPRKTSNPGSGSAFLHKMTEGKSAQFKDGLRVMFSHKSVSKEMGITGAAAFEHHSSQHVNISDKRDEAIMGVVDGFFSGSGGGRRLSPGRQPFRLRAYLQGYCTNLANVERDGKVSRGCTGIYEKRPWGSTNHGQPSAPHSPCAPDELSDREFERAGVTRGHGIAASIACIQRE